MAARLYAPRVKLWEDKFSHHTIWYVEVEEGQKRTGKGWWGNTANLETLIPKRVEVPFATRMFEKLLAIGRPNPYIRDLRKNKTWTWSTDESYYAIPLTSIRQERLQEFQDPQTGEFLETQGAILLLREVTGIKALGLSFGGVEKHQLHPDDEEALIWVSGYGPEFTSTPEQRARVAELLEVPLDAIVRRYRR